MKTQCEVIQDLLSLYSDKVCSAESAKLVEEHLEECPICKKELNEIKEPFIAPSLPKNQAEPIRAIAKQWKSDKTNSFFTGITVTTLLFSVISAIVCILCLVKYNSIGAIVLPDGKLSEPFYLIPLSFFFGALAVLSIIILVVLKLITRRKHRKS